MFQRELEDLRGRPIFFLDECGVDHRLYREYGRAPRGERIYQAVAGRRRERTSVISASQQGKFVAPFVFQGSCNTAVVDLYFEKVLLPRLPPGSVIVLDNARFHQSPTTERLVEAAGCRLLFLPPYSPDLNPIELAFSKLKTYLRKAGERTVGGLWDRIGQVLETFTAEQCANYLKFDGYAAT